LLQKCCLRLSANESYQNAEQEIEALTGVKVGHTTQQKLVLAQEIRTLAKVFYGILKDYFYLNFR
jgi:hypothetical protein